MFLIKAFYRLVFNSFFLKASLRIHHVLFLCMCDTLFISFPHYPPLGHTSFQLIPGPQLDFLLSYHLHPSSLSFTSLKDALLFPMICFPVPTHSAPVTRVLHMRENMTFVFMESSLFCLT